MPVVNLRHWHTAEAGAGLGEDVSGVAGVLAQLADELADDVRIDDVGTLTAYAEELSEPLGTSELTESKAFIHSFVKEIAVAPGAAHDPLHDPDAGGQSPARRRGRGGGRRRPGTAYRQVWSNLVGHRGLEPCSPHRVISLGTDSESLPERTDDRSKTTAPRRTGRSPFRRNWSSDHVSSRGEKSVGGGLEGYQRPR